MRSRSILLLSLALPLLLVGASLRPARDEVRAQSGGGASTALSTGYDVEWSVVGSAGAWLTSDGDYQMGFTLGQDTPPLVSAGGEYQVVQGYWALAGFCFWMDIDCNCAVNIVDLQLMADRWRCEVGDGCYDDRHDVDGDGVITVIDVMQIAVQWGWTCP